MSEENAIDDIRTLQDEMAKNLAEILEAESKLAKLLEDKLTSSKKSWLDIAESIFQGALKKGQKGITLLATQIAVLMSSLIVTLFVVNTTIFLCLYSYLSIEVSALLLALFNIICTAALAYSFSK